MNNLRRRLMLASLFAPLVAPYDPIAQPDIIALKSLPPSAAHPFGTDQASRDILSRVIYGARVSLGVAALSVLVAITVGTLYGAVAGYRGGQASVTLHGYRNRIAQADLELGEAWRVDAIPDLLRAVRALPGVQAARLRIVRQQD